MADKDNQDPNAAAKATATNKTAAAGLPKSDPAPKNAAPQDETKADVGGDNHSVKVEGNSSAAGSASGGEPSADVTAAANSGTGELGRHARRDLGDNPSDRLRDLQDRLNEEQRKLDDQIAARDRARDDLDAELEHQASQQNQTNPNAEYVRASQRERIRRRQADEARERALQRLATEQPALAAAEGAAG